jgi:hypothetical protein
MLTSSWIKVVAWFELWGGVWGILASARGWYDHTGRLSPSYLAVTALAFLFFVATAFAGYELARGRPRGVQLSQVLLVLQVAQFSVAGISYAAYVGAALTAGVSGWVLQAGGDVGSLFRIQLLDADSTFTFAINFVAVGAIALLRTKRGSSKRETSPA